MCYFELIIIMRILGLNNFQTVRLEIRETVLFHEFLDCMFYSFLFGNFFILSSGVSIDKLDKTLLIGSLFH
ncbi:hypothetical protein HZS_5019 [Henneguya salminicola]|nr:hypothetical protein HZS_5019 [Henneguya salminicola]